MFPVVCVLLQARILEEQQGVVVPVVLVDRHPLLSMLLEYAERECAHVAKQSRARALLKVGTIKTHAFPHSPVGCSTSSPFTPGVLV